MPLRTAPIPRMAGHLSFMRSVKANFEDLSSGSLAVIGAPMEDSNNLKSVLHFFEYSSKNSLDILLYDSKNRACIRKNLSIRLFL